MRGSTTTPSVITSYSIHYTKLYDNVERLTGYYPSAVKIFNQTRRVTFRDNLILVV